MTNREKVNYKIKELRKYAKKEWNFDFNLKISYKLDSTRTLGFYSYSTRTISLNENLLNEYCEVYINDVVVHEFAHAVIHHLYGVNRMVRPHGREFKAVCSHFNHGGKATSNLYLDSKTMKKKTSRKTVECKCNCKTHYITKNMATKISNGVKYSCRLCNSRLVV